MNQDQKKVESVVKQLSEDLVKNINKLLEGNEINRTQSIEIMMTTGLDLYLSCFKYVENLYSLEKTVETEERKNEIISGFTMYRASLLNLMPQYMDYQNDHLKKLENIVRNVKVESQPESKSENEPECETQPESEDLSQK